MSSRRGPAGSYRIILTFLLFLFAFRIDAAGPNDQKTTTTQPAKSTSQSSSASSSSSSDKSSGSAAPTVKVTNAPNLSGSSSTSATTTQTGSQSVFHLTGLPTLAGAGIPSVGVPNTQKAPYMQKSTLPEGTVFICVGAALGFLGAAVLAWRGLVAWSLHRSVKRAALTASIYDSKPPVRGPTSKGPYNHVGASSNVSLDHLASPIVRNSRSPNSSQKVSAVPSGTNLFFSPTAGTGMHSNQNRSSGYLPAGYYAPGASLPAGGAQMTHIGAGPGPVSGYGRTRSVGPSPPSSPGLPPSRGTDSYPRNSSVTNNIGGHGMYSQQSVSSLNLSVGQHHQGRTPSAYLEDLFENHGNGPRERF